MNRILPFLAITALVLGAPMGAAAHKGKPHHKHAKPAKTYKANLGPVGTDAEYAGIHGKAQLVDGKKKDKVSIHVRGLKAGTTYPWHIHETAAGVTNPCAAGAAQGPIVTAFTYKTLKARKSGNANSSGRSKTFTADPTKSYYVNVHDPASGTPIACGVLKGKRAKKPKKAKKPAVVHPKPTRAHGKPKPHGTNKGQAKAKAKGHDDN